MRYLFIFLILYCISCGENMEEKMSNTVDVAVYVSKNWGCGSISVSLNQSSRTLNNFVTGPFSCESATEGVFSSLDPGRHKYTALSSAGCQWEGTINVIAGAGCLSYEINENDFIGNICDSRNWILNEMCISQVGIDTVGNNCGLSGSPRSRLTLVNNCNDDLKIVVCADGFFNAIEGPIVAPGDTTRFLSCSGFSNVEIYSIRGSLYTKYGCEMLDCP